MGLLEIGSLRGVTVHLAALEKKGFITKKDGSPRGITITAKGRKEAGLDMAWEPSEQLTEFVAKLTPDAHRILREVQLEVNRQ